MRWKKKGRKEGQREVRLIKKKKGMKAREKKERKDEGRKYKRRRNA